MKIFHFYHLVQLSPWPILGSLGALSLVMSMVVWISKGNFSPLGISIFFLVGMSWMWWKEVSVETDAEGEHSFFVVKGLKIGVLLFIVSEVFFFVSFFWAFYHSAMSPCVELGGVWPPLGIEVFNPLNVPLLNTIVLLGSGVTITWCHHKLLANSFGMSVLTLFFTVVLGLYFTGLQSMEYIDASFSIADAVYGTTFFVATEFHGLHVIIGSTFLAVCLVRMVLKHFVASHLVGFEGAAWYWHFVDVVWLFLYSSLYWWGI